MSREEFWRAFNTIPEVYLSMKLNIQRSKKELDYCCVIEGSTDEKFYSNIEHSFFKENNIGYVYKDYNEYGVKGKKAVLLACQIANEKMGSFAKKCVFIIDKDDLGIEEFKGYVREDILNKVTVLPVYSIENFYLINKNLNMIIDYCIGQDDAKEKFNKMFNSFISAVIPYYALKRTKTISHVDKKYKSEIDIIKYGHKYKDEDIFINNSENFYDVEKLEMEIKNLNEIVERSSRLSNLFKESVRLLQEDIANLKGKYLYKQIANYIYNFHKIDFRYNDSETYREITRLLEVDIELIISQ